ncbi:MAG TPA: hypothetical protein VLE49_09110 [Anaerolineales bacterium]|nr:hypothetical protein [Anaerolineales bacterium]
MLTRIMIIAMLLATACTPYPNRTPVQNSAPPQQNTLEAVMQESSQVTPIPSSAGDDGLQKKTTQIVIKDLATRLGIDTEGIHVVSTKALVWPNAALGCPSPGKVYAQGRVPGYQIRLEAGSVEYVYNTDLSGQIILCPQYDPDNPDSQLPTAPGPTPHIGPPIK